MVEPLVVELLVVELLVVELLVVELLIVGCDVVVLCIAELRGSLLVLGSNMISGLFSLLKSSHVIE